MEELGTKLEQPCPECGKSMVLRISKYGFFYGCEMFPKCKATHGAHRKTGKPLGNPANKETKEWRIKAHDVFDKMWKNDEMNRKAAYRWMKKTLKITPEDAHIGKFDLDMCKRLIVEVNNFLSDRR